MKFMNVKVFAAPLFVFTFLSFGVFARDIEDVFPNLPPDIKNEAYSSAGYYNFAQRPEDIEEGKGALNNGDYDLKLKSKDAALNAVVKSMEAKRPAYIIENLMVIPDPGKKINLLKIYNALGQTRTLAGRTYYERHKWVPLFEDVVRIVSENEKTVIPDPAWTDLIPAREDIYFRVDDYNFGKCYYKASINYNAARASSGRSPSMPASIDYKLTNLKKITFFIFTVVPKEKLNISFHIEPLDDGVLLFAVTGIEMSRLASSYTDVPAAARRRFDVVKNWLVEGITRGL